MSDELTQEDGRGAVRYARRAAQDWQLPNRVADLSEIKKERYGETVGKEGPGSD